MSGFTQAENTRGGRKLAHINEDGLTKRQQRKKEIAAEAEEGAAAQVEMITLDEIDIAIIDEGAEEELVIALDEIDATGEVEEEVTVTVDVPAPPAPGSSEDHHRKGPHEELESLEAEPEPEDVEKKHHGKGKGKHKQTKDIVRGEGKPGNSLAEGGKKKKKGAKK